MANFGASVLVGVVRRGIVDLFDASYTLEICRTIDHFSIDDQQKEIALRFCVAQNEPKGKNGKQTDLHTDLDTDLASAGDANLEVFGFTINP